MKNNDLQIKEQFSLIKKFVNAREVALRKTKTASMKQLEAIKALHLAFMQHPPSTIENLYRKVLANMAHFEALLPSNNSLHAYWRNRLQKTLDHARFMIN